MQNKKLSQRTTKKKEKKTRLELCDKNRNKKRKTNFVNHFLSVYKTRGSSTQAEQPKNNEKKEINKTSKRKKNTLSHTHILFN